MAITPVPPLTDIPTFPALSDRTGGDYNGMAFAFARHMSGKFNQEIVPVVASAFSNATEAQANAQLATQAREQTQSDRDATAADRYQTNLDKLAAQEAAAQAGTTSAFSDANPIVKGSADPTKQLKFEIDGFSAGATRTLTPPDKNGTIALLDDLPAIPTIAMRLIATINTTGSGSVIEFFDIFTSEYDNYLITGNSIRCAANNRLVMRAYQGYTMASGNIYTGTTANNVKATIKSDSMPLNSSSSDKLDFKIFCSISDGLMFLESCTKGYFASDQSIIQDQYLNSAISGQNFSGLRFFTHNGGTLLYGGAIRVYGFVKAKS